MIMMWWCWSKLSLLVLFPSLLYGFVKSLWLSLAKHFQYTALLQWSWKRDRLDWLQPTVLHLLSIHLNLYTCLYILYILYIIFIYILYYIHTYIHIYIYTYIHNIYIYIYILCKEMLKCLVLHLNFLHFSWECTITITFHWKIYLYTTIAVIVIHGNILHWKAIVILHSCKLLYYFYTCFLSYLLANLLT